MSGANVDQVFKSAAEAAHGELNRIMNEFELLRLRRERIEKVADALRPLVEAAQLSVSADAFAVPAPVQPEVPAATPAVQVAPAAPAAPDGPFDALQRQISFALGRAAVA